MHLSEREIGFPAFWKEAPAAAALPDQLILLSGSCGCGRISIENWEHHYRRPPSGCFRLLFSSGPHLSLSLRLTERWAPLVAVAFVWRSAWPSPDVHRCHPAHFLPQKSIDFNNNRGRVIAGYFRERPYPSCNWPRLRNNGPVADWAFITGRGTWPLFDLKSICCTRGEKIDKLGQFHPPLLCWPY